MPLPNAIEVCRQNLYATEEELRRDYPAAMVDKVMRVRAMSEWRASNPGATDRAFVEEVVGRFGVSRVTAYDYLHTVKALMPVISNSSRAYERWRYSEMISETYEMAKAKGDVKTMERCSTSIARYNNVDKDDELEDLEQLYEKIVPQRFVPTDDPRVLGLEPIPNINARISELLEKYRVETVDIDDVDFEAVDVDFNDIQANDGGEESILQ